MKLFTVAYKGG